MMIVDLQHCVQRGDDLAHQWTRRVAEIIHSSDNITVAQAILILEKNCHFQPLVQKLGHLKRQVQDMGDLMDVHTKYAESDSTKDPSSDEDKTVKNRKGDGGKGQQNHGHNGNPRGQGNNGKRKQPDGGSDLIANTNTG